MQVKGNVFVGVQTEDLTTESDIVISAQRQGAIMIGDDNIAGCAFEVGNVEDKTGHTINFQLRLGGRDAVMHIDREGFFGLGAGILNKGKMPNGAAAVDDNPVVVDGVAVAASFRTWESYDGSVVPTRKNIMSTMALVANLANAKVIKVQARSSTGSASLGNKTLMIRGIG